MIIGAFRDLFAKYFFKEPEWKTKIKSCGKAYVLDASFIESADFYKYYNQIFKSDYIIILPSITSKELEKLIIQINGSHVTDISRIADKISSDAFKKENKYIAIEIEGKEGIVNFCIKNKEYVELLTSDKSMALLAKANGVKVILGKVLGNNTINLIDILELEPGCFITDFWNVNKYLMVRNAKNGKITNSGKYKLSSGDEIYLLLIKNGKYFFYHYRITIKGKLIPTLIYKLSFKNLNEITVNLKKSYVKFLKSYFDIMKDIDKIT